MRLIDHRRKRRSAPCFVVQHESAGSDHYDLCLEIGGALRSWTIPKDMRLARRAADYPLEYATRKGDVSDSGTYANATPYDMIECLERGYLSFHLCGERLRGCYSLTRIREGAEETWLLMRRKEEDHWT
jgi:DNA ligase D-like protein (predicted 3'-phosphoesterase)